jgi:hypothetical protein
MLVTGTNGTFNITTQSITHYYQSRNNVFVHYADGHYDIIECSSNKSALYVAREMFAQVYKDYVTIGSTSGRSYYINVTNVVSKSQLASNITVNFANASVVITRPDEASAIHEYEYLSDVYDARRFLATFAGTTLTVDDSGGADYTTIVAANAVVTTGQCVKIRAGNYAENFTLKNGVTYYFEANAVHDGEISPASNSAFTARILGYGRFERSGAGSSDVHIWKDISVEGTTQSRVFWECESIKSDHSRTFFTMSGRTALRIKGNGADKYSAGGGHIFDTDAMCTFDLDMVTVNNFGQITYVTKIGASDGSNSGGRCSIRNLKNVSTVQSATIDSSYRDDTYEFGYGYELTNVELINTNAGAETSKGLNYSDYDGFTAYAKTYPFVRFWNSIFKCAHANSYNVFSSVASQTFNLYGTNYFSRGANSNVTFQPSTAVIESGLVLLESDSPSTNINLEIMSLSNKPIKTKFQVGDTVWLNRSGQILSGVVQKTRTVVSNPNNDANGVQYNLYTLSTTGNTEHAESDLYRTLNFLLFRLGGQRLNKSTYDNLTSLLINPDMSGQDFSGCDFTTGVGPTWAQVIADGTDFSTATLPGAVAAKNDFKAAVKSYDPEYTIWTDGNPIN